jgi:hypothetical protein
LLTRHGQGTFHPSNLPQHIANIQQRQRHTPPQDEEGALKVCFLGRRRQETPNSPQEDERSAHPGHRGSQHVQGRRECDPFRRAEGYFIPDTPLRKSSLTFPAVHASVPSNTFAIYGNGEDKELTELVPGILNQLGPDSLASLRKLAESYQSMQKKEGGKEDEADDDEIPELVEGENFEGKVE